MTVAVAARLEAWVELGAGMRGAASAREAAASPSGAASCSAAAAAASAAASTIAPSLVGARRAAFELPAMGVLDEVLHTTALVKGVPAAAVDTGRAVSFIISKRDSGKPLGAAAALQALRLQVRLVLCLCEQDELLQHGGKVGMSSPFRCSCQPALEVAPRNLVGGLGHRRRGEGLKEVVDLDLLRAAQVGVGVAEVQP